MKNTKIKTELGNVYRSDFEGFAQYTDFLKSVEFSNKRNEAEFKEIRDMGLTEDSRKFKRNFHGTDSREEVLNMVSYIDPDALAKLKMQMSAQIEAQPVQDIRKKVRFSRRGEFSPDRYFAGDNRKCFMKRDKSKKVSPSVTVYISTGYNAGVRAKDGLYNALAGVVFVELLQKAGYHVTVFTTEISRSSSFSDSDGIEYLINCVQAKGENRYLDADTLAILASDPRHFRYYGFLGIPASSEIHGLDCPYGLGSAPKKSEMIDVMQKAGYEFDFFFGGSTSFDQSLTELKQALQNVNAKFD